MKKLEKLEIEYLSPADLVPYARNARTHSPDQVQRIAASIKEFGFTSPILIDGERGIIAGHGRLAAAQLLKLKTVPTIKLDGLTEAQKKAYILADNRLALDAGWDQELLALEFADLEELNYDLRATGFTLDEIEVSLEALPTIGTGEGDAPEGEDETAPTDAEENDAPEPIPEPPEVAKTRRGDVWILEGGHRLMCGDSTDPDDVATLAAGQVADFLHADPPYGMGKVADGVENDDLRGEKLKEFNLRWFRAFRPHTREKINVAIWGNAEEIWRLWFGGLSTIEPDMRVANEIVWDKPNPAGTRNPDAMMLQPSERCLIVQTGKQYLGCVNSTDFPPEWKPLLEKFQKMADSAALTPSRLREITGVAMWSHWFSASQFTLMPEKHYAKLATEYPNAFAENWETLNAEWQKIKTAGRDAMAKNFDRAYFDATIGRIWDVWHFDMVAGDERPDHPTPKNLDLMAQMLRLCLEEGKTVMEPFSGSGQTLLAAEKTGRVCYAMELQPKYVDLAVIRWQELTGKKARREKDGRLFDSL